MISKIQPADTLTLGSWMGQPHGFMRALAKVASKIDPLYVITAPASGDGELLTLPNVICLTFADCRSSAATKFILPKCITSSRTTHHCLPTACRSPTSWNAPLLPMLPISWKIALRFFFSSRRRHTGFDCDWSSDVCSSDLRIERAVARPPEEEEQERHADRAGDVAPRQHCQAEESPRRGGRGRDDGDGSRVPAKCGREGEARQVDDAVRGRDEQRQIVQAVVVDAPEDRPGHLSDRGEADDAGDLHAALECRAGERDCEHDPGECAERELLVEGGEMVGGEERGPGAQPP